MADLSPKLEGTEVQANSSLILKAGAVIMTEKGTPIVTVAANGLSAAVTGIASESMVDLTTTGNTVIGDTSADTLTINSKIPDDVVINLGTTLTNAATKVTLEYDKTTTGIGQFHMGDLLDPQVLVPNPGATVAAHTINILHSAGAGTCDDLLASYKKIAVTGSGDAGLTIVGDAPRTYVGVTGGANNSVASAAYASQPWAKHAGTGAITAISGLSAKLDVTADNFTASTANAGHFHIDGGATVTGQYDGVMVEAYPAVRSMDSLLALAADSGAVVESGIRFVGSPLCQMTLSSTVKLFTGTAATRAAVRAEVGDAAPIGSVYFGQGAVATTKPHTYIKVVHVPGDTDWERVVTQAAD